MESLENSFPEIQLEDGEWRSLFLRFWRYDLLQSYQQEPIRINNCSWLESTAQISQQGCVLILLRCQKWQKSRRAEAKANHNKEINIEDELGRPQVHGWTVYSGVRTFINQEASWEGSTVVLRRKWCEMSSSSTSFLQRIASFWSNRGPWGSSKQVI